MLSRQVSDKLIVVLATRITIMKSHVFFLQFLFVVSALTVSSTPINLTKNSVKSNEIVENGKLSRNTNTLTEMNAYNNLQQLIWILMWKPVPETCRWETKTKCVKVQWHEEEKRLCRIIPVKKCRKIS